MSKFLLHCAGAALLALAVGCQSEKLSEDLSPVPPASPDPAFNNTQLGPGSWVEGATDGIAAGGVDANGWREADPSGNRLGMPVIYFAYDSDLLVPSETANLDKIAAYMADKPKLGLVIEGHCDQRGTDEYNRALGERRANAIRAYLVGKGLSDSRFNTVSYGEDKPAVDGNGESVWRQNRRGVPVPMIMP
ncbi:MAG: OmpA family protein [Victivallaceae bacterium]|nr:OmpA family protein [Victivallaceae bacterium]